jgi:hypothetical protein
LLKKLSHGTIRSTINPSKRMFLGDVVQPIRKDVNLFGDLLSKFEQLIPVRGRKGLSLILSILLERDEGLEDGEERNLRIEALRRASLKEKRTSID